ncbi:MAG: FGGY family carbohydrate kinase [Gallionella sp.]
MKTSKVSAIALDLGTTSIKAGLLNRRGELTLIRSKPAPKIIASGGRYESDAIAYATAAECLLDEIVAQAGGCKVLGMCLQRSTFVIWDKESGLPVTPLISWQDDRGASSCADLKDHGKLIRELSGLPLTPYYFAPKLRHVLQQNPDWLCKLEAGQLLVGTLDTFLLWRWSGGTCHVTDGSMAARTLLMDTGRSQWSEELCDLFEIPIHILPDIRPSDAMEIWLNNGLKVVASVGDQSAALIASVKEDGAEVLVNLGTGCFVVRFVAESETSEIGLLNQGYLHTLVYQGKGGTGHFALEGSLNSIASVLRHYPVEECTIADMAINNIHCIIEPNGMGAPFFVHRQFADCYPDRHHINLGVQFSEPVALLSPRQIAALLLEAVIFRVARILEDFRLSFPFDSICLSGGLSELASLQQGIAMCARCTVFRLTQSESSLLGVALLAAGLTMQPSLENERVLVGSGECELYKKYLRWKDWLDKLLNGNISLDVS